MCASRVRNLCSQTLQTAVRVFSRPVIVRCEPWASRQPQQIRRLHAHQCQRQQEAHDVSHHHPRSLPLQCPGCGAFSQTTTPGQPGFFNLSRTATKQYLGLPTHAPQTRPEDQVVRDALQNADSERMRQLGLDLESLLPPAEHRPSGSTRAGTVSRLPPLMCMS